MKGISSKLFYTLGVALLCGNLHAQSLAEAKKLYEEGKYAEAKPAFERLVKQAPNNSSYNQWYGVCCYETGDLAGAEKHLAKAVKRKVQESYRYMAEVYYRTYRFDQAVEMLEEYIAILNKKKKDPQAFEARLEEAENAQRMVEKAEDVQIIDSLVVDKADFLSAYTLSEESGTLATYQDFFQTPDTVRSTVYENQKGDKIYYAKPAEDGHYYLFTQSLLMDKWGDEKRLPMNVNSEDNDNYPFVLSDGITIYYASEGNGSIGGYDLFVTRYNTNSDSYLAPEQLSMPFNSPYNDFLMVYDEVKQLGWFVSDRFQPDGKVCVYLFIPNPDHKRLDSENIEWKRSRAAITAIRDSWPEGADYTGQIELAHTEIPYGEKKVEKDFEFIIGNGIVYYTLDEIHSPEAKKYYSKVVALKKQIAEINQKLDGMRADYTKGNAARKEQLKTSILDAEQQLDNLLGQPEEQEKLARNAEIKYLKNKR